MSAHEYTVIPAGVPPAKLDSGDDQAILEWCKACQTGRPLERLSNEALKYWIRYCHPVGSPEYNRICERIDALVKDIAPAPSQSRPGEGNLTSEG